MATKIQLRRDTAASWANANPILSQGEPAFEIDTGREKIGDGVTEWNSLAYRVASGGIGEAPEDGNQYARKNAGWEQVSAPADNLVQSIAFTDTAGVVSVPFTHMITNIAQKVLDAQYDFQPITTGAQDGFGAKVSLIADGDSQHVPTFTGFESWANTDIWDNTAGVKNEIVFYLWGSTYYYNITNSTETVIDTPPSASSVSISGSLVAGNQITGNYTYNDVDGDPESGTTFQWYRADNQSGTSKAAISGATSQNYTLDAADVGKHIQFGVTPANANSTGAEALSAWSNVVEASDTTAPTFSNISVDNLSDTTADFNAQINEAGTIFWAAFPTATAQQTNTVIENGTGAVDFDSVATFGGTIETDNVTGLTAITGYKIHYFSRDSAGNESDPAITSEFSTTAAGDTTPPTFSAGPASANVSDTSFDITATLNENGTVYAVVVADGASAPSSAEVKAGTGSGGSGQLATDSAVDSGSGVTLNLTGLTASTAYDVYVVAEDDEGTPNLQASPTLVNVTTTSGDVAAPVASFNPLDSATNVAIDSNIVITFNEAILNTNGTEVTDGNVVSLITLKEDNISGVDIAFSATINVGKTEITINPTSDLSNSQAVFVQVNNFEDAAGNEETSGQSAIFTTVAAVANPLTSATISSPANELDLVFDSNQTITLVDWSIATDNVTEAALSISSVQSGDGTTNVTMLLSRRVLTSETLTVSNATLSISADSITNNSVIVMQDGFIGSTIDTSKFTVTDPADAVTFVQLNDSYLTTQINTDATAVPSANTNNIETIIGVSEGCVQIDFAGSFAAADGTPTLSFAGDWSNFHLAQIMLSSVGKARFTVYDNGSRVYDTEATAYDFFGTWRIRYQASNTTVYWEELTAANTWTVRDSYVADITNGNTLKPRYGSSGYNTNNGVVSIQNEYMYLTNGNYSTSQP
jgi:hypothetical protein